MHFTVTQPAVATTVSNCDRVIVRTPQRKANCNDKARLRRKDLKEIAFKAYSVNSSAQVRKYLKMLGVKLDLRLTTAWDAIVFELRSSILAVKAVDDALKPSLSRRNHWFKKGDVVDLVENCSFPLVQSAGGIFRIYEVDGDLVRLEYFAPWIPVAELIPVLDDF